MRSAILYTGICLAILYIILRILYPVLHLESGYVLYAYPLVEGQLCKDMPCAIDRSRTAIEIGVLVFLIYGAFSVGRRQKP
jgi:hypothetical protein